MITQEIHLKTATYGIPPVVHMVQGDSGRELNMVLDDMELDASNDAVLAIHRPDDSYYEQEATVVFAANSVTAPAYQAITRPGKVECQLKISDSDELLSTFDFVIQVHESVVGLPVEQLGYDIYDLIEAAETITPSPGLTDDIKQALLDCFEHVAWTDEHGQDYVDALEAALYPPAELASISAVYTQSGTVYDTDTLDSLRDDLVVTAYYDDSSSEVVTTYTLSGTLVGGTSTITVSYGGKTTTFTVNVYQPAELVSISAVYTQSGTVYDTDSLDSLKSDLVVTALYDDQTTATVTDYTLSGTLTEGTSTITVSYGGKTTTFTVTVTEDTRIPAIYNWDLTSSLTDSVGGITASTNATLSSGTGLELTSANQYCDFGATFARNRTYELDVTSIQNDTTVRYRRLLMFDTDNNTASGGCGLIWDNNNAAWRFYAGGWDLSQTNGLTYSSFDGKTVKMYIDSDGKALIYTKTIGADDSTYTLILSPARSVSDYTNGHVYVGSSSDDHMAPATFTGLRIYEGEK